MNIDTFPYPYKPFGGEVVGAHALRFGLAQRNSSWFHIHCRAAAAAGPAATTTEHRARAVPETSLTCTSQSAL